MKRFFYFIGLFVSALYIINPAAGVFELLPDNLPFVGNLDEAAATGLLLLCLRRLGVDITAMFKKNKSTSK